MKENLIKEKYMLPFKLRLTFLVLLMILTSNTSSAQIPSVTQTLVFQLAEQVLQTDLEQLVQSNAVINQKKSAIEKQRSFAQSINVLPNPELGINWSPTPMQKSLNQTFAVRAMQMIPWPGTIAANLHMQQSITEQQEWLEFAAQLERLTAFKKDWFDGYALTKQLKWIKSHLNWINTQQEDLQTKLTVGTSQSARIELEIERIQLEQKLFEMEKMLQSNARVLDSYFGEKKNWEFPDTLLYKPQTFTEFQFEHPLLKASSAKQKSSTYQLLAAQKEGLPMIGLGAEYMVIDEALKPAAPEMQMQSAFMLMATITLPVYRSKYASMEVGAKSAGKEAQFEEVEIQRELEREFKRLLNERMSKEKELQLYGEILPEKWNQLEQIALEKWQNGSGSFGELIRIKRSKIDLKQRFTSILTELKKIEADLSWLQPFSSIQKF